MKSESSRAEGTAALLLEGEGSSSPVLIPGARERRVSASAGPRGYATGTPVTDHAYPVAVSVRERLVYEREGGGAPSERSGGRPATILQKLWRGMRRRPEVPDAPPLFISLPNHHEYATTYAFGFRAVQDKAPSAAGVYAIFTSRRWLYIGESDDIRQSLFQRLNDPNAGWSSEHRPLSFSFETAPTVAAAI